MSLMEGIIKNKKIIIGCGIAALIAIILSIVVVYIVGKAFFKFGIGSDLSEYRNTFQSMKIDAEIRNKLMEDFKDVRLSLDERNNFEFFQWLEIDKSIEGILSDGKIDAAEYGSLQTDIARMKKIQGIEYE